LTRSAFEQRMVNIDDTVQRPFQFKGRVGKKFVLRTVQESELQQGFKTQVEQIRVASRRKTLPLEERVYFFPHIQFVFFSPL
jgi:hypothetical protein